MHLFGLMTDFLWQKRVQSLRPLHACILAGLVFAENQKMKNALIFGCVGGLAALCRAELLIYLPLVAAVRVFWDC